MPDIGNFATIFARIRPILTSILLAISFLKLPASSLRSDAPQSWEPVLSYAAFSHLQWGKDIVFTYGPLGFLGSDYYWGYFFWPIVLWAILFSVIVTATFLRLLERIHPAFRTTLLIALLVVTTPLNFHLGFDPIYFLAIVALAISSFPEERPGLLRLLLTGVTFAILAQIKFTFLLYAAFAISAVSVAQLLQRKWSEFAYLAGSTLAAFLGTWLVMGQNISHLPDYFHSSFQIVNGYAIAMAIPADPWDLTLGVMSALLLLAALFFYWYTSRKSFVSTLRACIVGEGVFLAWKEGFVRADAHVVVFFVFAFLLFLAMPAFLLTSHEKLRRYALPLTITGLVISAGGLVPRNSNFILYAARDFLPKLSDAFTAVLAPPLYRSALERNLDLLRHRVALPTIQTTVGNASVGVLNYDQDVAILNGLNYKPHPVFQNYVAYTPELQQLNSKFFISDNAPNYIIWRYGTIDARFPTLDDGQLFLEIPQFYKPILREGSFLLLKRNSPSKDSITLQKTQRISGKFGQPIPISDHPIWLKAELNQTWMGSICAFAYKPPAVFIDVLVNGGETFRYRLTQGNAASGFLLNPLLQTESDLSRYLNHQSDTKHIVALSIQTAGAAFYQEKIEFSISNVTGVAP